MSGMLGGDRTVLTGNAGGVVPADGNGNFNIVGSGALTVTGNPLTNTLTISGGGVSGMTEHAVSVGNATGGITSLAVGTTGTVLIGNTAADPSWSASPTLTSVLAGTFDTNVTAAAVTLSGTTLSADGTDADININITAKGAGQVIIDDLQLGTPLTVPYGGTGAATHTIHGVLIGNAAGAINAVADVTNAGYVLTANVGADPSFQAVPTYTLPANVPQSFPTDSGTATPALNALTVTGGTNLNSSGAGSTVTLNLDSTITLTGVNATTFDTNVVAAGTTLSGTTWAADGTDANIGMTITPKGTGALTLTSGNINLPVSNSANTTGCIYINGVRYFSANVTAADQMSFGYEAGLGNAGGNFAIGYRALKADVLGGGNFACGINCLAKVNNVNGIYNAAMATGSMQNLTSGDRNCGLGRVSLGTLVSGSNNVAIGDQAGNGYTGSESNNICIGATVLGTASESNTIRIGNGTALTHTACYIGGIYGVTPGGTKNIALIDSNHRLGSTATLAQSYLVNGLTWNNSTSTPVTAAVNNEYTINTASGLTTINLPATFAVNDRIKIVGSGVDGWTLVASSGDTIQFGSTPTSSGGSLSSTVRYDSVEIVGIVANTTWNVIGVVGTLTVA